MQLTLTPIGELKDCLDTILSYKKLDYVLTKHSIIFYGNYPVRVKALIEKLMIEEKIEKGKAVQFNNAVMYSPTGHIKFYTENYAL